MDPDRAFPPPVDPSVAKTWLDTVEAALGARALGQAATIELPEIGERAGLAAVAAKFLAVGTPRTMGLVGVGDWTPAVVAAQRAYAMPRELRVFDRDPDLAARGAAAIDGRVVSLAAACACDIVVVRGPVTIERAWIRGGTLLTALTADVVVDPELIAVACVYTVGARPELADRPSLGAVAAGLIDGRTLDEICLVVG